MPSLDSFKCQKTLKVGAKTYVYYSLPAAEKNGLKGISKLPYSMKVLLENMLRNEDDRTVTKADIVAFSKWASKKTLQHEIAFRPARVLMQDFTGVPAVVDLAAMRNAMKTLGGDAEKINPLVPVDLVIDHSVIVNFFGDNKAFGKNVAEEYKQNQERYEFLKWGQKAFSNFSVVPPGTGICHQVNLEYLSQTVWTRKEKLTVGKKTATFEVAYPDSLVGTDSHTTMVNGLAVLGWGVGGIEAEACMLGQPLSMLLPDVVGFKLKGQLKEGVTATDLVLTVTQMLRKLGVVGKFVEFFGAGLDHLALADRATIANMAPEYGATCGIFPVDGEALNYLRLSGRGEDQIALVEAYAKAQGLWRDASAPEANYSNVLELDMATVKPSLAGPKRPQDRVLLEAMSANYRDNLKPMSDTRATKSTAATPGSASVNGEYVLKDGAVVIAAITSCTNTSNPAVMLGAGLLARNAVAKGLTVKPWVKPSLGPGSLVVTDYLKKANVMGALEALKFHVVGYGCTTCIGNSGPLPPEVSKGIADGDLVVASVLSGNRNFEGRVHSEVKMNYLASPPLVVAYAIAGTVDIDLTKDALGNDQNGNPVYLRDIWPSNKEISDTILATIGPDMFNKNYADVFKGDSRWNQVQSPEGDLYRWDDDSTYIKHPPYFEGMTMAVGKIHDIIGARALGVFGDSITTDHISPAGDIKATSPAGSFLQARGVTKVDFNSYGARRGNDDVMVRGTFANIRIKNLMLGGEEGGNTIHVPTGEKLSIYDAAMRYKQVNTPLVVIAGKEYGTGSSRDWAAKGTMLLGVKAVIAETFERIHRSNLVGMGVLPMQFMNGQNAQTLGLTGLESYTIAGLNDGAAKEVDVIANDGISEKRFRVKVLLATPKEVEFYRHGGLLHYVLRQLARAA